VGPVSCGIKLASDSFFSTLSNIETCGIFIFLNLSCETHEAFFIPQHTFSSNFQVHFNITQFKVVLTMLLKIGESNAGCI
jgi:hypothetical protein